MAHFRLNVDWFHLCRRLRRSPNPDGPLRHALLRRRRHLVSSSLDHGMGIQNHRPPSRKTSHRHRYDQCRWQPVLGLWKSDLALEECAALYAWMGYYCRVLGSWSFGCGVDPSFLEDCPEQFDKGGARIERTG